VIGLWADPVIETFPVYCGAKAVGTSTDVAARLNVEALTAADMTGDGVDVAIVDGGVNLEYLQGKGVSARLNRSAGYSPAGSPSPGEHPVGHGTMCAFDACIAAPQARLLDLAVLTAPPPGPTRVAGYLSNAVAAYGSLLQRLRKANARRPLVVTNSWGLYDPSWDFPADHPGNYTDNASHPFNVIVASLEQAGADILFAAGNCGQDCPDGRCAFPTRPISGANSHPAVLCVAGVDVRDRRLGYSSQGPGRLMRRKPDIAAYAHFTGSQALLPDEPADTGTSTACPVAAGVIAAIRSVLRPSRLTPAQLRSLLCKTARDLGPSGWDGDYGWGVIDPPALLGALDGALTTARGRRRARRPRAST
jgi:subtilisin family serine protease